MATSNAIKVVARFRPQNKVEIASGGQPVVTFESDDTCKIQSDGAQGAFTFDRVFGMDSRQHEIFDYSIRSTVDDIMDGYNGTVFAYGQTGAGKSYSMMGSMDDPEQKGIIPRITEQIFAAIQNGSDTIDWLLRVSYMEIYMEQIRDLLKPANSNLPIHEEKGKGVYVKGLTELYVQSAEEVYEIMRVGGEARKVASTNMNQESSRSHSIFVINVEQENRETKSKKSGTLFLVDLAGSEKVGKTGASGQTLEEAKKINKSLSALGMVINALTDGKSSHIPYRDSKLTRILQESLGGNSRTTLIICCSPSSFNDQETLSTLRFGTRAKAIKNKAKVNAELSPAELKNIIKKYELQNASMAKWIALANPELIRWHAGETVAKEDWTPNWASGDTSLKKLADKTAPGTPGRIQNEERAETPSSRPDSRLELERSATPSVLDKDEREEFLRRENELQDQLAEKESALALAQKGYQSVKEELAALREHDAQMSSSNQKLSSEIHDLQMQLDRIKFDMKEEGISMDSLKEANAELTAELDEVKQQLLDARTAAREHGAGFDEKERLKRERMAKMMAGFDLGGELFSDNERSIRKTIEQIDALQEGESISPEDLKELRRRLLETQGIVRQAETSITQKAEQEEAALLRREALERQLSKVQAEYEAFLEGKLSADDVEDVKARLADSLTSRQASEAEHLAELREDLSRKTEENKKLAQEIEILQQRLKASSAANGVAVNGTVGNKTVQQQFAEFEVMKKSLMRDLQNRCERVVELEISLDETREQYNNVLRTSNNRAQQKKMAFLERNLEQLTVVQRQLVEQNSQLKKEAAIAERKLATRTERIRNLEALLHDSQEKLTAASHRFEVQLQSVKERLEAAKAGSTRGLGIGGIGAPGAGGFNFGGPRIAKPLRGGGGGEIQHPGVHSLQANSEGGNKRNSWFSNLRS
ncbi:uncharacterized protein PV09_01777 [Verruconis gallopava]|uniref:Kinesin-like protein n=1 Tax=Verruconis gallopava TaxID=253628 RepID=A0A0D1Z4H0_9PEZI|nr:uncharacterized protein PV09_01777 [Verruconis gallopava]KIW07862.1 hypothetical protein PV09_01777 [Verruconis gallopava]